MSNDVTGDTVYFGKSGTQNDVVVVFIMEVVIISHRIMRNELAADPQRAEVRSASPVR